MSNKNRNQNFQNNTNALAANAQSLGQNLKTEASNLANAASDAINSVNMDSIREQASELKGKIVTLARNSYDYAKDEVVELKGKTAERIKDEPLRAGAVAFGAGIIIGALIARRL